MNVRRFLRLLLAVLVTAGLTVAPLVIPAVAGHSMAPMQMANAQDMAAAALLSVTLVPALMVIFVRGRIVPEGRNVINRFLIWIYRPVIKGVLRAKTLVILAAVAVLAVTAWPAGRLGTEFMAAAV